ncbi:MAG: RNA polymerase sigma factor [Planctomycetota bacterium]
MKCPDPAKLSKYYESGAPEDFEAFVLNSEPWIFKRARYLIRGTVPGKFELAEDVTWTTLRKVEASRYCKPWFPEKGALGGWLFRMIRNQVSGYLRVKSNQIRPSSDFRHVSEDGKVCLLEQSLLDHRRASPQQLLLQAERLERAKRLLQQLPPGTQQVVAMYFGEGLTYREIALELDSNPTAVYRQVALAPTKLAALAVNDGLAAEPIPDNDIGNVVALATCLLMTD